MTTTEPKASRSEAQLRSAMARLLDGHPEKTDGALTKKNLYLEAGVSRATMNRSKWLLSEWEDCVRARSDLPPTALPARGADETVVALRRAEAEIARLTELLTAAKMAVGILHHDNQILRDRADSRLNARLSSFQSPAQGVRLKSVPPPE